MQGLRMQGVETVDPNVELAAERLRLAGSLRRPCPPIRDLVAEGDVEAAYAVQRHVATLQGISGARVVGRKIGLTSEVVQRQLGVGHPASGLLLDTMLVPDGRIVSTSRLMQPLIEAELMLVLGEDLDSAEVSVDQARSAVSEVSAALEIVDTRIDAWDITLVDAIADNVCSGLFVPASARRPLADLDLTALPMELRRNGVVASSGTAEESCFGDPIRALAWLAEAAQAQGSPLRAGEMILTGALGPMLPVAEGESYTAVIGDLPTVSVHFRSSSELNTSRGAWS